MEIVLRRRSEPAYDAPVLVASAEGVNVADSMDAQHVILSRQQWQQRVWGYYDEVGEIHFPARYVGNALSKIRLVAAEISDADPNKSQANPDPIKQPVPTANAAVKDAINKLKSDRGGQGGLLRSMGLNLFVAAECFLLGIPKADGTQNWEAVSINEMWIQPGMLRPLRRKNPMLPPEELPKDTLVIRVWNAHPRYSGLADSALRTVMDECEKLLLLTRADKAAARSRFAGAGILFIPNELMPVSQQPAGTANNTVDAAANPIYQNLIESMITPIKDEQHPSGVVPITIFGPAEYGERIRYITFDRPQAARAQQQREESITRIATALDLPSEILTGKADLNHWTAWQVKEETFQQHFQPMVELICDALTIGYLRPALIGAGMSADDAEKYLVWYDDSELVVRPDKGETAGQLFEANVISAAAWRRETGFTEDDAMDDDEYRKRVGILLQDVQLALTGKPTPVGAPGAPTPGGFGGDSPTVQDKMTPAPVDDKMQAVRQGTPDTQNDQPKPPKPVTAAASYRPKKKRQRKLGQQLAQLDIELMTQLRTAATEVLVRELDRAGARIRSKAQGDKTHKELLANIPNHLVASVLGPSVVASLSLSDSDLMKGAFALFGARAAQLLAAAQAQRTRLIQQRANSVYEDLGEEAPDFGAIYDPIDAQNRDTGLAILLTGLTAYAASRLYDPAPDAAAPTEGEFDNLLIPAKIIRDGVSAAGGSITSGTTGTYEPEDFGGIGTGGTTYGMFSDAGIHVVSREWVYGPAIRTPFASHEDLDGLQFSSWDDDALAVKDGDDWLGVDFYHPGDHRGCLCAVAPITDLDQTDEETS